ncbi:hypothetical protein BHM03_00051006 [Ensete ventricosum]|nr:hypothetical protein BHM03_00051006 [Ensete ventricosum]
MTLTVVTVHSYAHDISTIVTTIIGNYIGAFATGSDNVVVAISSDDVATTTCSGTVVVIVVVANSETTTVTYNQDRSSTTRLLYTNNHSCSWRRLSCPITLLLLM